MPKQFKNLIFGTSPKGELRYDPDAGDSDGEVEKIPDKYLPDEASEREEFQENIFRIDQYNSNLVDAQEGLPQMGIHHSFMVIETDKAYYSLEKDGSGVTMQRSNNEEDVLNNKLGEERSGVTHIPSRTIEDLDLQMKDVLDTMYENDELNKPYNARNTCQHFAKDMHEALKEKVEEKE